VIDREAFISYALSMLRIVVSAVMVTLLVAGVYMVVVRIPKVKDLAGCYEQANRVYDQKHVLTRRTTNEQECEKSKVILEQAARCFSQTEDSIVASDKELEMMTWAAKNIARTSKSFEEMVEEHNQQCSVRSGVNDKDLLPDMVF
jgi:hypothetical protein